MKKLTSILLQIIALSVITYSQSSLVATKSAYLNGLKKRIIATTKPEKISGFHSKNLSIGNLIKGKQDIMPDSASTIERVEGDTIYGYINFLFSDTLQIEEHFIKDNSGYSPLMKEEFHFDNSEKNTGYYISFYGNDEGGWTPEYKAEINYTICEVAGFRNCIYGIGRTYEWNSDRSNWRGGSGATDKFDSFGRKIESANYAWDEDIYDWVYISRTTWDYNNFGMTKLEVHNTWSTESETWIPDSKDSSSYDEQGRILLELLYQWDQKVEKWDTIQKRDYSYSENNSYQSFYEKDLETGYLKLYSYSREEFIYNERNLLIRKNQYARYSLEEPWGIPSYELYEYNENDKLIKSSSDSYESKGQVIFDYDTYGHLILEAIYNRKQNDANWVLSSEKKYKYDITGNLLEEQHYYRDEWNQDQWKKTNEYDDFGNQLISTSYSLDLKDSTFVYSRKSEKLRDNAGRINKVAEYVWDTVENKWIGQYGLDEYFYQNGLLKKIQYSEWDSEKKGWDDPLNYETFYYKGISDIPDLKIDSIFTSFSPDNDCTIHIYGSGGEGNYYYSIDNQTTWGTSKEFSNLSFGTYYIYLKDEAGNIVEYQNNPVTINITAVNTKSPSKIRIFPNPFEDRINIELEQLIFDVSIYNVIGERVYAQKNLNSTHCIHLDKFDKGIYLIYVITKKGSYNQKIIKR